MTAERDLPCTALAEEACDGCSLRGRLMCRFDRSDLLSFLFAFLPFGAAVIVGMVIGGYSWAVPAWFGFWVLFFFVIEGRVLCSHCPYWAEEGGVLRCHANYGVVKLWRYRPGPMSRWEQAAFIVGTFVFVAFPLLFLLLGRQYGMAVVALVGAANAGYTVARNACQRCVNFSCPVNRVPKDVVDGYLRRNPQMRRAWEENGYCLGEPGSRVTSARR